MYRRGPSTLLMLCTHASTKHTCCDPNSALLPLAMPSATLFLPCGTPPASHHIWYTYLRLLPGVTRENPLKRKRLLSRRFRWLSYIHHTFCMHESLAQIGCTFPQCLGSGWGPAGGGLWPGCHHTAGSDWFLMILMRRTSAHLFPGLPRVIKFVNEFCTRF